MPKADQRSGGRRSAAKADSDASWHRYRPQPKECPICGNPFTVTGRPTAKTCPSLDCKREYERRYARGYYEDNSVKIIAQTSASRRRRHKPISKQCKAPHPIIPGALCGKEFEVKATGDGRRLTCSPGCSRRRRWVLQRDRYKPSGTTRTHTMQPTMRSRLALRDARTRPAAESTSSGGATKILVAGRSATCGNTESPIAKKSTRGSARSGVQIQELTRLISGSTGKPIQKNLRATVRRRRLISGSTDKPIS
jgi:hypothetical protein